MDSDSWPPAELCAAVISGSDACGASCKSLYHLDSNGSEVNFTFRTLLPNLEEMISFKSSQRGS